MNWHANKILKPLYNYSPYFFKCIMASTQGAYLEHLRYDSTTPKRIEGYLERECWSGEEWKSWKDSSLEKLLYNAKKYVPFYQQYWATRGKTYEDLKNWPIITKKTINENPDLFVDQRFEKAKLYHDHTSGTTGTPLDIYLDHDSVKEQYALFEARVKLKYNLKFNDTWSIIGSQRVTKTEKKNPEFCQFGFAMISITIGDVFLSIQP